MFCSKCGKPVDPSSRFCPACGATDLRRPAASTRRLPQPQPAHASTPQPHDRRSLRRLRSPLRLGHQSRPHHHSAVALFTGIGALRISSSGSSSPKPLRPSEQSLNTAKCGRSSFERHPERSALLRCHQTQSESRQVLQKKIAAPPAIPAPSPIATAPSTATESTSPPSPTEYGTPLYVYSAEPDLPPLPTLPASLRHPPPHHLLRRQSQLLPRHPPPPRPAGSRLRHRLRRRARARPQSPQTRPQKSRLLRSRQTALGDRRRPPTPTSSSSTSNPKPSSTSSPPAPRPSKVAPASPSASTPTSSPKPTPTSPPASANTSSASTSTPPAPSTAQPQNQSGSTLPASPSTSARRSAKSIPSPPLSTRVTSLIADLRKDGHNIRYVDAGGGLGIDYGPHFGSRRLRPRKAGREVRRRPHQGLADEPAHLLLEPGRFIVAQAGALLTRVLYVKKNGSQDLRHHRRRHERPHPPRALPRPPRDHPRQAAETNLHHLSRRSTS